MGLEPSRPQDETLPVLDRVLRAVFLATGCLFILEAAVSRQFSAVPVHVAIFDYVPAHLLLAALSGATAATFLARTRKMHPGWSTVLARVALIGSSSWILFVVLVLVVFSVASSHFD